MEFDASLDESTVDTDERLFDVDGESPHDAADALIENGLNGLADGPPPYLSPSSASTFQSCPRRWKFRYMDHLPDPAGEAALAGTFAHRVLEVLCQAPAAERTVDAARSIARDVWPETIEDPDFVALNLDESQQRRFRWLSWTAIEGLWRLEDPALVTVESTEQKIDTVLDDVPFRGIVDRIDRASAIDGAPLVVTDYKSGRAPSPRFAEPRLLQVLLYAAAIEASTGQRPQAARLLYLGQCIVETEVTAELIETAVRTLTDTWEQMGACIDADDFAPKPGPLCGWCPYADQCDEGLDELAQRVASGRIRSSAPALRFLPGLRPAMTA